ncbi:hypothetical protein B566_EDAN010016, partial [Ephemera danica]
MDTNTTGNESLTWIGPDGVNVGEDQLLYVTYVGDPANCSTQLTQPMLLQVTGGTEGQLLMCQKQEVTENFEENVPVLPEQEPAAAPPEPGTEEPPRRKYTRKRKQPSATLTDDVNIETKFQVLEAMCPPPAKRCRDPKHCNELGLFKCDMCEREYNKSAQFYGHLNVHAHLTVRPHTCGTCGLQFTRESQREYHERNVHLEFCSKAFFRQSDLKTHLNIHLGIRKNTCEICGKQFQHISN